MFKRNLLLTLAFLLLIGAVNDLFAQGEVTVILQTPPPNRMGIGNMWDLSLTNTTDKDLKIYLTGTATEGKDGLIIEGKSKVFTMKPGRSNYKYNDFTNVEIKYNNDKYKEIILRTGNAPEGNYTICVTAYNEQGEVVGQENCIMQNVKQMGSITLISPEDGAELNPEQPIIFSWTPLPGAKDYTLRIVEIKGDQSPDVAMKTNKPVWEKSGIATTTTQVPYIAIDEPGLKIMDKKKKWGWIIKSGEVESKVWTFSTNFSKEKPEIDTSEFMIELISPNSENPITEQNPEFVFKAVDNKDIESFNLQIYEIVEENGSYKVNTSKTFYEVKGLKEQKLKYPADAPLLDSSKIYAWKVDGYGEGYRLFASSYFGIIVIGKLPKFPSYPCLCMVSKPGTTETITVCMVPGLAISFPKFSLKGKFLGCKGTATYSWTPSLPPTGTGTFLYTCKVTLDTVSCTYNIVLNVIRRQASPDAEICSETLPSTQCCGNISFRLRTPGSGCPGTAPSYPSGTTYQWYIMKSTTVPGLPSTSSPYSSSNICQGNPSNIINGNWYTFGSNFPTQLFPGTPAELPATIAGENYYVVCRIDFPGGSFNCMRSGFTGIFNFTVAPPINIIATVTHTDVTCTFGGVSNGTVTVAGITGGTGPYEVSINPPDWDNSPPYSFENLTTGTYVVRIRDVNGCLSTFPVTLNDNYPTVPIITANLASIPCNGFSTLTATVSTGFNYEWLRCNEINCTDCDPDDYSLLLTTAVNTLNITDPGCYRVRIIDANGACNTSGPISITSEFPIPEITGLSDLCTGSSLLTASALGGGTFPSGTTFQWYTVVSGTTTLIAGATSSTYAVTSAGTYSCSTTVTINGVLCTMGAEFVVNPCNCTCNWNSIDVTQNSITTNLTISGGSATFTDGSLSNSLPIVFTPNFTCSASNCNSSFNWRMTSPTLGPWTLGAISQFTITTGSTGYYVFEIIPFCGGIACNPVIVEFNTK